MEFSDIFLKSDKTNRVKAPHAYQNVDIAVLSVMWLSDTRTDKSFLQFASFQWTDHVNLKVMVNMLAIMGSLIFSQCQFSGLIHTGIHFLENNILKYPVMDNLTLLNPSHSFQVPIYCETTVDIYFLQGHQ